MKSRWKGGGAFLSRFFSKRSAEKRCVKTAKSSWAYMSQVLGNPGLAGRNLRIQAGELLKVIDLCAASSAMKYAGHATCPTLVFDRVELLVPCCHGDLVHMDSRVVSVGKSTMAIQILGRKRDVLSRQWIYTHEAFATFVSLDSNRRPTSVAELKVDTAEEIAMQEYVKCRQQLQQMYTVEQQARETQTMTPEDAERVSTKFKDRLTMNESTLRLRKNFLPRNLNGLGTIFGGDLLEWMEGAAHLCASNFTRNSHVITIAMDKVLFKVPISVHHLLELTARVVYCRNHTLQVETIVTAIVPEWAEGSNGIEHRLLSHKGYFTILNMTEYGHKRPLSVALDIRDDKEGQAAYLRADHRFHFWHKPDIYEVEARRDQSVLDMMSNAASDPCFWTAAAAAAQASHSPKGL